MCRHGLLFTINIVSALGRVLEPSCPCNRACTAVGGVAANRPVQPRRCLQRRHPDDGHARHRWGGLGGRSLRPTHIVAPTVTARARPPSLPAVWAARLLLDQTVTSR